MTVNTTQTPPEPRPKVMPVAVARAVRIRVCSAKRRLGRAAAQTLAAQCDLVREAGEWPYAAYRCPFAQPDDRHWHVGHVLDETEMATVAMAIRVLYQAQTAT